MQTLSNTWNDSLYCKSLTILFIGTKQNGCYSLIAVKVVNHSGSHDIKGYEVVTPSFLSYYALGLAKLKSDKNVTHSGSVFIP